MGIVVSSKLRVAHYRSLCQLVAVLWFFLPVQNGHAADCTPIPTGIVSWWGGDGNAADLVGTNSGILQGGASAGGTGMVGSAFTFNGTNSYVQIPDSPVFHPTNFTLEFWVRFASLDSAGLGGSPAGDQYVVFKQNSRSTLFEGFDLSKTRSGNDYFRFEVTSSNGTSVLVLSASTISTGVWYHVAAVRGSNYISLYINGQLERQTTVSFPQDYGTLPLFFGTSGQSFWDHKLSGSLDEVSLYNRVLSASEIQAVYTAGSAGKCRVPPVITADPQGGDSFWGSSFTFSAAADGSGPLRYQWQKDGTLLPGATSTFLSITNIQFSSAGLYSLLVSNFFGSATSQPALLTCRVASLAIAPATGPTQNAPGVSISGVPGQLYGVQACTNLAPPTIWFGLTNIILPQKDYTWYDPVAIEPQKFYRVVPGPTYPGAGWETTPIGAVVADNFDRDSLGTNWVVLADTSVSINSNQLFFNHTNTSYVRQVYYQPWETCSDEWTIRWSQRFATLDATSFGVGVGIKNFQPFGGTDRGYNGILCGTGTNLGRMQIERFNGSNQTLIASGSAMPLAAGDTVDCSLTRSGWILTVSATNRVNGQSSAVSFEVNTSPASGAPTISRLCYYPLSGAVYVDDFSFTINHRKPARFVVIGASMSEGYNASTHARGYVNVVQTNFAETVCNDSCSYNTTADALSSLPEILAHQPGTAILLIGGNDVFFGVPTAQWQQNYSNLVTQLQASGVKVKHCAVPRNTADLTALRTWVSKTFPANDIIDTWDPMAGGVSRLNASYDSGDGVHPNDAGHLVLGQTIRNNLP
jgi:lysophospholipase L1-like esterase